MKTDDATDRGMLVPSPLGWQSIPSRPRQPWKVAVGAFAFLLLVTFSLNAITVPYYALSPGEAVVVDGPHGAVTAGGAQAGGGRLYLTTVALNDHVTLLNKLFAFLHPDTQLVKKQLITQGANSKQFAQQNQQEMTDSQLFAKVAALRRLGFSVPETGDGALVEQVDPNTPATSTFKVGDVIRKVDGRIVTIVSQATAAIRAHKPGDAVDITFTRPGSPPGDMHAVVRPIPCGAADCPDDPQRALVGVSLATDQQHFNLPKKPALSIATNDIGGPSAGLAFTLGAIDALTSGNLTGGHKVAVTGTIDPDGNVGPVGGVDQKTVAVEQQHCAYFLVPPDEFAAASAKAKGHNLTVVSVATLDDALRFLQSIGGDTTGIPQPGAVNSG